MKHTPIADLDHHQTLRFSVPPTLRAHPFGQHGILIAIPASLVLWAGIIWAISTSFH